MYTQDNGGKKPDFLVSFPPNEYYSFLQTVFPFIRNTFIICLCVIRIREKLFQKENLRIQTEIEINVNFSNSKIFLFRVSSQTIIKSSTIQCFDPSTAQRGNYSSMIRLISLFQGYSRYESFFKHLAQVFITFR